MYYNTELKSNIQDPNMKIKHLMEGAEPKLPGAASGIQIMTPQQFVAKSATGSEPKPEQGVAEGLGGQDFEQAHHDEVERYITAYGTPGEYRHNYDAMSNAHNSYLTYPGRTVTINTQQYNGKVGHNVFTKREGVAEGAREPRLSDYHQKMVPKNPNKPLPRDPKLSDYDFVLVPKKPNKNQKKGVAEATKLPAQTRPFGDEELTSYLDRIRKQEKQKTDKYKLPYIHRSSVMGYYNEEGKKYNVDAIKAALKERPKALLKKNEKMKHSDGELEQFFNIGFAALVGIALDENTNELIVVNTCPGAGSCKVDCFAMKGGKIQFQGPWLSDGRILTYLLNDPDGFFSQLKAEIQKEEMKGKKGGYKVSIRWHDAGDFFSPEYVGLAFKLARELPNVDFYAYTKMGDVATGEKPDNFMINWSEGAHTSQEKKVKAADPTLAQTKNSRIVPTNLFYDLLVKDEKKNLVKGAEGQWQVIPDRLPELKQRLAKEYGLSPNSILSYKEWDTKGKKIPNMKWNVIITPGEPDITAKDPGVLSTLLLKH